MSRRRKVRRTVRWARYVNHYSHIPGVLAGGNALYWTVPSRTPAWVRVRSQAKCRYGATS